MGILSWIVLGLIAGWFGHKLVGERGGGFLVNTATGVVGALIGGEIMTVLGEDSVTGFNIYSLAVAVAGSVILLVIVNKLRGTSI